MSFGAVSWGGFQWGTSATNAVLLTQADVLTILQGEVTTDGDVLAVGEVGLSADGDVLCSQTVSLKVAADTFVARLDPAFFSREATPLVLITIELPGGALRVATRQAFYRGFGWTELLSSASDVERALGESMDDVRLDLADQVANGTKLSRQFTDANPPEGSAVTIQLGALNDPTEPILDVFHGILDEVVQVVPGMVSIEVVRSDSFFDRLLGRKLTVAIEADAPEESLGSMIPHVYGTVDEHEGLVVDFNEVTALSEEVDEAVVVLRVDDPDVLASSGTGRVEEEKFTWSGKSGDSLTGVARGTGGTAAAAHPSGSELVVVGTFAVTLADHAIQDAARIRILGPDGNLLKPLTDPTLTAPTARLEWDETPQVLVPSKTLQVIVAGMEAAGASNTVSSALNAARENPAYTDGNYATIGFGEVLGLKRSSPVQEYGSITRVGLAVVFDPDNGGGVGSSVLFDGSPVGTLSRDETLPEWAVRSFLREIKSTYDGRDTGHDHPGSGEIYEVTVRPRAATWIGPGWEFPYNAANGNLNDRALQDQGSELANNYLEFKGAEAQGVGLNDTFLGISRIEAWVGQEGGTQDYGKTGFLLQKIHTGGWRQTLVSIQSTRVAASAIATLFFVPVSPGILVPAASLPPISELPLWAWQIVPSENLVALGHGLHFAPKDFLVRLRFQRPGVAQDNAAVEVDRHVTNMFDVTSLVADDWSNLEKQIEILGVDSRIAGVYWVVENRPARKTTIRVPRVFADTTGLQSDGRPEEIARKVISQAEPLGMDLGVDSISEGSYQTAGSGLAADGVRLDFAVRERISAVELLRKIATQADCRQHWDLGAHVLTRKPVPGALVPSLTLRRGDVIRGTMAAQRSPASAIANQAEASYRPLPRVGDLSGAVEAEDAASQVLFGIQSATLELDLVRDDATAALVVTRFLARSKLPRWLIACQLTVQAGLQLRRGDVVALDHQDMISFAAGEVLELPMTLQGGVVVMAKIAVWQP